MSRWTYTFAATKDERVGIVFLAQQYLQRVLSTLVAGEVFDVTLSEHVEKRSNAQNRMMWGTTYSQLIAGLAEQIGYEKHEKDYLHEALTALYGGTVEDKATGVTVRKFRTSKATKQEFTDYIEWLARWAAQEHGVVIVLPGENV